MAATAHVSWARFTPLRRIAIAAVATTTVLALTLSLHAALDRASSAAPTTMVPSPAPELSGPALSGSDIDLRELRGKVVLVNVWASWCAPCRKELPLLIATAERHRKDGLALVGINAQDKQEPARAVLDDVAGTRMMPSIVDPEGRHAIAWGVRGVPETFVINRSGQLVARHLGEVVTSEWIETFVLPLLEP